MLIDKSDIKIEYLSSSYRDLASIIGVDAVLKIYTTYRGTQMFFPVDLFNKDFIAKQIVKEYSGNNLRELAIKYGYTEKWIRKILKDNLQNRK